MAELLEEISLQTPVRGPSRAEPEDYYTLAQVLSPRCHTRVPAICNFAGEGSVLSRGCVDWAW
jgi:hypothetical protein